MVAKTAAGISMIIFQSMTNNIFWLLSRVLQQEDWPYMRMFGISCFVTSALILIFVLIKFGTASLWPRRKSQLKWVIVRGTASVLGNVLAYMAVQMNISFGDLGALTSINTVIATLLGRVFLREPLHRMHILAVAIALVGASFIARPRFVFGNSGASAPALSYLCALLSGFCQACLYIVSRKAVDSPAHLLSLSACFQVGASFLIFPYITPILNDGTITQASAQPWAAAFLILLMTFFIATSSLAFSQGAKWVPAAMSATVDTATLMASGYLVEAVWFGRAMELYPLLGASMMLISVVIMAATRVPAPALIRQGAQLFGSVASVVPGSGGINEERPYSEISPTSPTYENGRAPRSLVSLDASGSEQRPYAQISPTSPTNENGRGPRSLISLDGQGDAENVGESNSGGVGDTASGVASEKEGLISFIASEFVDSEPQVRFPVRRRRHVTDDGGTVPGAQQLGALALAPATSAAWA